MTELYVNKSIKNVDVTVFKITAFSIFPLLETQTLTKKIRLFAKMRNFILADFCSLYNLAKAETAEERRIWVPVDKSTHCSLSSACSLTHSVHLPLSITAASWQNGRKHALSGQGRRWCQQPRTIKGVKVLPSLNCSRSAKWEPKLFTSFSEQTFLNLFCCYTSDRGPFEQNHPRGKKENQNGGV